MPEARPDVEINSLQARLQHPPNRATPAELAETWFDQTVWLRLGGVGALADDVEFCNHLRRSLGGALGTGASPQAGEGRPCPWHPPCALDVLFREHMREGEGLPKPFVAMADAEGDDLLAGLRVFGFATDWMPAVEHAFADAVRHRLPWRRMNVKPPPLLDRTLETRTGVVSDAAPDRAAMHWITPVDAEAIDPRANPRSILTRLHRRLDGLARWHDSALEPLSPEQIAHWDEVADASGMHAPKALPSRSGMQRRNFTAAATDGCLDLHGDLRTLWPLLGMGERCGVGRGAVKGRGRYELRRTEQAL